MRERFCKVCRKWHDPENWPEECWKPMRRARSDLAMPMVMQDSMAPVQSMTNGKYYDSKAALRAEYRRAGVVEVGNEKLPPKEKPKPDRKAIKAAVGKAFSRAGLGA